MKKAAILFALLIALSGCGSAQPTASSQTNISNESSISQNASDLESSSDTSSDNDVSEAAASETAVSKAAASEAAASVAAASEAAASEAAASEAAVSEAAASEAEASEAAASEAASSESASSESAASEVAASEVAASEVAASEAAVSEAAVSEAAASSESAVKSASEVSVEETSNEPAPDSASSNAPAKTTVKTVTGTNFLNSVEKLVLRKINREREAEGLSALTYDEDLRSAARLRSRELYKANKFEHKRPNGDEWNTVLDEDIPVDYIAAGENLCMTEYNDPNNNSGKSATFWVDQWMESPPHYENLMRSEYTHAGVGIYYIEKDGMVYAYATMIFAQL